MSLYFRRGISEPWTWLYVDHQDLYWWRGRIDIAPDVNSFTLKRGNEVVATVNLAADRYILRGEDTTLSIRSRIVRGDPLQDADH